MILFGRPEVRVALLLFGIGLFFGVGLRRIWGGQREGERASAIESLDAEP